MNRPRVGWIVLTLLVGCWSATAAVGQNLTDAWVAKTARPLIDKHVATGLSIGYLEGDHYGIVHLGSAGKKRADNLTVYEIGSISKVFTGLLLADAVVRGEIKLDAAAEIDNAAGVRLPAQGGRKIQWAELSTHRSGLPQLPDNLKPLDVNDPYRDYDAKQAAAFFEKYKLPRAPGEAQEYSNLGASILGYLVAERAGKSYQALLQERIAQPLKMSDCSVSLTSAQKARLATPHDAGGSVTAPWTFADLPGAGGIHATMRDMMRFAKAQLVPPEGKLGEAIELAWKQQSAADASGPATGLGWMIAGDGETRWHDGQTGGFSSTIFINRPLKCAVVILCNTSVGDPLEPLATQLILKAAGKEVPESPDDKIKIDDKHRRRLVGRYQLKPSFVFTVNDRDGHLMVGITDQPTQEVYPDSPTRWSYRGVEATLEFKLPKTGPARSLILHQNGVQQTAKRIVE